jgi:hypothetical protein
LGGGTTFEALIGVRAITNFKPWTTQLKRTLSHVIDYGVRPNPVFNPAKLAMTLLNMSSRVDPTNLTCEVLYYSSFYANGLGIRSRTEDELGIAFRLPSWMRSHGLKLDHLPVVPIHILEGCIEDLSTGATIQQELLKTPIIQAPRKAETSTWLPRIQRWLPTTWGQAADDVVSKAQKRDDGDVPVHLWNDRILLLFPWCYRFLIFLRLRLMVVFRHGLWLEFREYMHDTHGPNWASRLVKGRHGIRIRRRGVKR